MRKIGCSWNLLSWFSLDLSLVYTTPVYHASLLHSTIRLPRTPCTGVFPVTQVLSLTATTALRTKGTTFQVLHKLCRATPKHKPGKNSFAFLVIHFFAVEKFPALVGDSDICVHRLLYWFLNKGRFIRKDR